MNFFMRRLVVGVREQALLNQIVQRRKRQIRIDGAATVADEQRKMMHLARLAGFENQSHFAARALADQMMMQTRHREQRGNRRQFRRNAAVGQNQNVRAAGNRFVGPGE